jgi:hypothetical protein
MQVGPHRTSLTTIVIRAKFTSWIIPPQSRGARIDGLPSVPSLLLPCGVRHAHPPHPYQTMGRKHGSAKALKLRSARSGRRLVDLSLAAGAPMASGAAMLFPSGFERLRALISRAPVARTKPVGSGAARSGGSITQTEPTDAAPRDRTTTSERVTMLMLSRTIAARFVIVR